ncbi:FGGY carbohydrate kinase domain-containing protein [Pseudolycoriella hygida]|uniref:FGGY carbohydrate kinase domain-containing protein n=1 Tax=Pseudolycoriella hygida TaxID=35572 RepID=A0A9Q0N750_9DIPT|nr:FGGY carbohydrate kinase domain-containing protein [Pseudolycoriella hygida]
MSETYFVGVDVGTGSSRAALVTSTGKVVKTHVKEIKTWNPRPDHYEQSSDDIWQAVCECVKAVSEGHKEEIAGIGFDATCSLVAVDVEDKPLTVSTTGSNDNNIILWMDHRAVEETDFINETNHGILKYVGGKVSLEMQCPKLLWLKKNLTSNCWSKAGRFFDLPDFLTWKCTGDSSRSLCSVVCKWNYDAENKCWSDDFLGKINLSDLSTNNYFKLGSEIREPGETLANGLTPEAAEELGLPPGLTVGASMIDAHAGALALFGCSAENVNPNLTSKMALICGTSSCHMSVTSESIWANGVWGPYEGAIFPNKFLHEGGQSATGILLDFVLKNHPAYEKALRKAGERNIYEYLNEILNGLASFEGLPSCQYLTKDIHVWPDFHGNRSPFADQSLKGMISGLTMSVQEENLAVTYLAFVQALAYGTRHILDCLKRQGRPDFETLLICGGLSKNPIFIQTHADCTDLPVLCPNEKEMVLVGAAILGACASKFYPDLESASHGMGGQGTLVRPDPASKIYHERKYKVFLKMVEDQRAYKEIMNG